MIKVLVTGATGFVGSHAVESLMQQTDIQLIAAARDKQRVIAGFKGEIRCGDIRDADYIAESVKDVDVIVHAATWSSLFGHKQQSHELFYQPTIKLIDAAKQAGVKRFINISTTSAAAPEHSADADSRGIKRAFWPHLCNLIEVEDYLRKQAAADQGFSVINLRLGIFTGQRYGLGVLPILLPRLKTHLVPWIAAGKTTLPLIDGRDIGQAITKAVNVDGIKGYEVVNIVGPLKPTVRDVIEFLNIEFGYPTPHFSVPFWLAYPFAGLMEKLNPLFPFDPLVTRSIVHLLEETNASNDKASRVLGYQPQYYWQDAIRLQVNEMQQRQIKPMSMACPMS